MKLLDLEGLSYDDITLVPQFSSGKPRDCGEVKLNTNLCTDIQLEIPIISANMDSITELHMANTMYEFGGCGAIHRFLTHEYHLKLLSSIVGGPKIGCVGVGDGAKKRLEVISGACDVILVDVAHAHTVTVSDILKHIKENYPKIPIIAGNVSTYEGANFLLHFGVEAIKVGQGPGRLCKTRVVTGNGVPQVTAITEAKRAIEKEFYWSNPSRPRLIADGGIKDSGDIVKALAIGADSVMVGSLLGGTTETPGDILTEKDGSKWKVLRGMASRTAQQNWKSKVSSIEGISTRVPFRGSVTNVLEEIRLGILSGFTYQGVCSIEELQANAVFMKQSSAGFQEGLPRA